MGELHTQSTLTSSNYVCSYTIEKGRKLADLRHVEKFLFEIDWDLGPSSGLYVANEYSPHQKKDNICEDLTPHSIINLEKGYLKK